VDLDSQGTTYQEISTHHNPKAVAEVMRLTQGEGIVPVVVAGDKVQVGFGGG
jgi:glutaredoxin